MLMTLSLVSIQGYRMKFIKRNAACRKRSDLTITGPVISCAFSKISPSIGTLTDIKMSP